MLCLTSFDTVFGRSRFFYWCYYCTHDNHKNTYPKFWWLAYHLLSNVKFSFSLFTLWLYLLCRLLVFVFNIFLCFIFSNCLLELWYQANYVRFLFPQYSSLSYLLHFNIFIESWLVISVFSLRLVSDRFASYTLRRMFSKVIPSSLISLLHTSSEA